MYSKVSRSNSPLLGKIKTLILICQVVYRQKRAPQVLCCIHISCLPVAIKLENRNKFQAGLIRIILRGLFPESQNYGQSKPPL